MKLSTHGFEVINFLLLVGAPKINVGKKGFVMVDFLPFAHQEIFPQSTCVLPQVDRIEIGNNGIPDAIVPKINFKFFTLKYLVLGVKIQKLFLDFQKLIKIEHF